MTYRRHDMWKWIKSFFPFTDHKVLSNFWWFLTSPSSAGRRDKAWWVHNVDDPNLWDILARKSLLWSLNKINSVYCTICNCVFLKPRVAAVAQYVDEIRRRQISYFPQLSTIVYLLTIRWSLVYFYNLHDNNSNHHCTDFLILTFIVHISQNKRHKMISIFELRTVNSSFDKLCAHL